MTNYGQTSKEIQEEFEKEEEPIEDQYMRTFPKRHSSILPHVKLGVDLPSSMGATNMNSLRIKIPHSNVYNDEWRNFGSSLFGKKKRE
jgi:hypothetical protein